MRGLSAAIYGQVVVTSIVAALEIHEQSPPAQTLAALALGALHVLSRAHSVVVSVSLGVVTLLVLGAVAAARAGGSRSRILATAVLGAGCGLIVVALKVVVH